MTFSKAACKLAKQIYYNTCSARRIPEQLNKSKIFNTFFMCLAYSTTLRYNIGTKLFPNRD
jgi:hypothetical protein